MSALSEFSNRFMGRYFGKYRGVVADVDDPDKRGRLKVQVPSVLGTTEVSNWAWPITPYGGGVNTGMFFMPEVGDLVWVEFEEGDKNRPIWCAGPWGKAAGVEKLAGHAQGDPDASDLGYKGTGTVPKSQFAGTYPNVRKIEDPAGNKLEFDATPGAERVLLQHASGAHIEINPDGTLNLASAGNRNSYVIGNLGQFIAGRHSVEARTSDLTVHGNRDVDIRGKADYIVLDGVTWTVREHVVVAEGDVSASAGGSLLYTASGNHSTDVVGGRTAFVGKSDFMQVLESAEWMVSNSLNLVPTATSWLQHAYNGSYVNKATDLTGAVTGAILELGQLGQATLYAGTPADYGFFLAGSYLDLGLIDSTLSSLVNLNLDAVALLTLDSPLIRIGGAAAVEPAALGTTLVALLSTIMTMLDTHTHVGNLGAPTSPPVVATYSATWGGGASALSAKVFLD